MKIIKKKGAVIIFLKDDKYCALDLDKNMEICERSPYFQYVIEEFEHYWRKKYIYEKSGNNSIFSDEKDFSDWFSFMEFWKS
jgi:hypothetical protein